MLIDNTVLAQVPTFLVRLIEDLALSNGLSIDELYQSILRRDSNVITTEELECAATWLLNGAKKPWLALEFGKRTNFQQLDVFGPLIASCETVKEALELFHQYQRLLHPLFGLSFEVMDKTLCLRYTTKNEIPKTAYYAEAILGAVPIWSERLTGKQLEAHAVWFRHSKPSYADKYGDLFQCDVLFNQAYDALWMDACLLERPILSASPQYHSKIKAQASTQLQSLETIAMEIKRIIRISLPEDISVDGVAKLLHCSERTMQRKLAEEQTHFKALKQEVRKEEAIRLLETTSFSIEQIAFQLGYEQRSSFAAAFQRWTGVSPAQWRR